MNKSIRYFLVILTVCFLAGAVHSQDRTRTRGKEKGMILDLTRFSLGTMNKTEDRKQYMSTIQLEKQRIENFTLGIVYENAFFFYRRGDYQRAHDLAMAILAVDPEFKNARTLAEQAHRMGTFGTLSESEIIAAKTAEAERLHANGRLVEANRKFDEILAIQPNNGNAKNWQRKISKEIAQEHERRGDAAYAKGDFEKALDQWYSALLIRKEDPSLVSRIVKVEKELKDKKLTAAMKEGAEYYSAGKLVSSFNAFQRALKIQPAEPKAQKFSDQLRTEIAQGYVNSANKFYKSGKYDSAIANWNEAKKWGYDANTLDAAIKKARNAKTASTAKKTTKPISGSVTKPEIPTVEQEDPFAQDPVFDEPNFNAQLPTVETTRVSEENRRLSQEAYGRGVKAFNDEDYETARKEWNTAKQLDPGNADAEQGLRRVQEMLEVR
ncbi:Tetratricopeptide TPR_2 repeat protein [Elusimicrobium minutum Pei191]|uniref:Tetratricopeptide TPR_2 repeat protein n=1 Tax=Elusimicrobium minutum (strain Pei191) TaxID=445932 RepID=B2KE07_ELUMP|nr:Tetratricopeptide domain-containing protein [Elusimicrobium minutum]ACC98753.1 Tetratricopeptide TPR_2 repeat protein [Elusimicrobium minutum Pei191]